MIYIIISNIGLALITIVMYIRYSHFRISSNLKIRDLNKALKDERAGRSQLENDLRGEIKAENEQVKTALRDLEESRKERQEEIRLRLMAEKQIELAGQKIKETEARVHEWKVVQDNALRLSQNNIMRVGNDLFQNISKVQKRGTDESRHFIEQNMSLLYKNIENIEKKLEKIRKERIAAPIQGIEPKENIPAQAQDGDLRDDSDSILKEANISQEPAKIKEEPLPKSLQIDEVAKKSLEDVVSLVTASGLKHLKDYVLASKLDAKKAKFMLCDLVIIRDDTAYLIDFKADRYFKEIENLGEKEMEVVLPVFQKRIDKYLAYISNPKYRALIEKLIKALKINYKEVKIVFALRNRDDVILMRDLKYIEKTEKLGIETLDVNGVNDLVL